MIRITNREEFHNQVSDWLDAVAHQAERVAVGMAKDTLHSMLVTAPQYSGQFVASWNASIGSPDYRAYQPPSRIRGGHVLPYEEGDADAIDWAMGRFDLSGFQLGQSIFLANRVEHDEPYSVLIEDNAIEFRPENPSKGKVLARAMNRASHLYANLTRTRVASLIGA